MTMTVGGRTGHPVAQGIPRRRSLGRRWAGWLLLAYLIPLAALVLSIRLTDTGLPLVADAVVLWVTDLDLISELRFGHIEALANIAIFLPVGFLLAGLLGSHSTIGQRGARRRDAGLSDWVVWLVATAMSAGIEMTQLFLLTERSATLRDLACNSAGALSGILIYRLIHVLRRRALRGDRP